VNAETSQAGPGLRVLVVEDNQELAENLFEFLEPRGFVLDHAGDGVTGLHLAVVNHYDVIVLDLTLPGIDGLTICERLRRDAHSAAPILILTARDQLDDKLKGFACGADDYLVKPFDLPELEARIRVLHARILRREHVLRVGDLSFDIGKLAVRRDGRPITLNRTGERLLRVLMQAYPNVVDRDTLTHAAWGDDPPDGNSLRSHIYALRKALDEDFDHKMIQTVHRYGYKLVAPGDH